MIRNLFVGLDLSFNSSGISMLLVENNEPISIKFDLLLFDKKYKFLRGVTQNTYRLPTNVTPKTLTINNLDDIYSEDQNYINSKYIMAAETLYLIITNYINKFDKIDNLIIGIEGFISPQIMGNMQFRSLTGIIMMQGALRSKLIIKYKNIIKFNVVSPSNLKLFFTGNGAADKYMMLDAFINQYSGEKLVDCSSLAKINDIVDAFALTLNVFYKFYKTDEFNAIEKRTTKLKKLKNKKKIALQTTKKKVKKVKRKINEPIDFKQWLITTE